MIDPKIKSMSLRVKKGALTFSFVAVEKGEVAGYNYTISANQIEEKTRKIKCLRSMHDDKR